MKLTEILTSDTFFVFGAGVLFTLFIIYGRCVYNWSQTNNDFPGDCVEKIKKRRETVRPILEADLAVINSHIRNIEDIYYAPGFKSAIESLALYFEERASVADNAFVHRVLTPYDYTALAQMLLKDTGKISTVYIIQSEFESRLALYKNRFV